MKRFLTAILGVQLGAVLLLGGQLVAKSEVEDEESYHSTIQAPTGDADRWVTCTSCHSGVEPAVIGDMVASVDVDKDVEHCVCSFTGYHLSNTILYQVHRRDSTWDPEDDDNVGQ